MMKRKSFVNTPAARMLSGNAGEQVNNNIAQVNAEVQNPVETITEKKEVIENMQVEEIQPEVKKVAEEKRGNQEQQSEKEPMTKVLIEMSLMDSYKINNIVNAMKLKNKGKYTKKQFYAQMIEDAIEKFEKELGL